MITRANGSLPLVLLVVGLAVSCGGSDDDGSPNGTAGTSQSGAAGKGGSGNGGAAGSGAGKGGTANAGTGGGGTGGSGGKSGGGASGSSAVGGSSGQAGSEARGGASGETNEAGTGALGDGGSDPGDAGGANGTSGGAPGEGGAAGSGTVVDSCVVRLHEDYALREDGYLTRHEAGGGESVIVADATGQAVPGVTTAFSGMNHGCATESGGGVFCWPTNAQGNLFGQLGADVQVPAPFRAVSVHTGPSTLLAGASHVAHGTSGDDMIVSCAIHDDQTLYCWGYTTDIMNNGVAQHSVYARQVPSDGASPLASVLDAAVTATGACALIDAGAENELFCWGANTKGEAGTGAETRVQYPTRVAGVTNPSAVRKTAETSCVIEGDNVKCWGGNLSGECGVGSADAVVLTPGLVETSDGSPLDGVVAIESGATAMCALRSDGSLYCWGNTVVSRHAIPYALDANAATGVTLLGSATAPRFMRDDGRSYLGQTSHEPNCFPLL